MLETVTGRPVVFNELLKTAKPNYLTFSPGTDLILSSSILCIKYVI
jgi:hypothetical protein